MGLPPLPPPLVPGLKTMLHTAKTDPLLYMSSIKQEIADSRLVKYVPCRNPDETLSSWYRRFVVFAKGNGVFVPPYETLEPMSIMGRWFPYLPPLKQAQLTDMADAIHSALSRPDVFPIGSFEARTVATQTNGYHALHIIMCNHHPALRQAGPPSTKPRQFVDEHFDTYAAQVKTYALEELAMGNEIDDNQLITLLLTNCHSKYASIVQTLFLPRVRLSLPHVPLPMDLHIDLISSTLQRAVQLTNASLLPATGSFSRRPSFKSRNPRPVHQLTEDSEDYDPCDDPDIPDDDVGDRIELYLHRLVQQSADSAPVCHICSDPGHRMLECPKLAQHVLCALHLKDKPYLTQQVQLKHSLVVPKPRTPRAPSSTVHQLASSPLLDPTSSPPASNIGPDQAPMHCLTGYDITSFDGSFCSDVAFAPLYQTGPAPIIYELMSTAAHELHDPSSSGLLAHVDAARGHTNRRNIP
jgi:hypothetical protein